MPFCSLLGRLDFLGDMPRPSVPVSLGVLQDSGDPLITQPKEPKRVKTGRGFSTEDLVP